MYQQSNYNLLCTEMCQRIDSSNDINNGDDIELDVEIDDDE